MSFTIKWPGFSKVGKDSKTGNLLLGGDFCPIRRYEEKIIAGATIFDDNLCQLFKASDFSMVNLEAVLCNTETRSECPSGYGLRAAPEIADYIKTIGIKAVGLANNHIRDFGDEGVLQTIDNLNKANVLHTGAGSDIYAAEQMLVYELNEFKIGIVALAEKELNLATASRAGAAWFRPEINVCKIKELKDKVDFLIVFLHAGHEFMLTPSPRIRQVCRLLIDAGADAVIAHHPHVPQGVEKYNDAFIAYSLGNLVFDSNYVSSYKHTDLGYMVRLDVGVHRINEVEIIPCILGEDQIVRSMASEELDKFSGTLNRLSEKINDDTLFEHEWEQNVTRRWEQDYKGIMKNFSKRFSDSADHTFIRWARNFFSCPTHTELIEKAFYMIEKGTLNKES